MTARTIGGIPNGQVAALTLSTQFEIEQGLSYWADYNQVVTLLTENNFSNLLDNLIATTAPTADEDSGDGYAVGSRWIDVTNDKEYVCLDATLTAAVWTETTSQGGNAFGTFTVPAGTNPVAETTSDTLNLTSADSTMTITGTEGTDTVDFAVANAFTEADETKLDSAIIATSTQTVTVGSGGDYSTINAALEALTSEYPVYNSSSAVTVIINLLTGFTMAEQVLLKNGVNLSWIKIQSVDATVTITRSSLTAQVDDQSVFPAFGAFNGCKLPVIDCLFDMDTTGTATRRDGVYLSTNCEATILPLRGVRNAGGRGLSANRACRVSAHQSDFRGAGDHGVEANRCSRIDATQCTVQDSGGAGLFAQRSSMIDAHSASVASGCQYGAYATDCSIINASSLNGSSATIHGIFCVNGAMVSAPNANLSGATTDGCRVQAAALVHIESADCSGAGARGIHALRGAVVNAQSVDSSGATTNGTYAIAGAQINFVGGNAQMGGSPAATDIVVVQGSNISAASATGGLNITANTTSANGHIYQ